MSPFRILYLHPSNELYGADRSLLRLVKSLDNTVYYPYVVLPNDMVYEGLLAAELRRNNIPFMESNLGVLRRKYFNVTGIGLLLCRSISSAIRVSAVSRREKINLIHSNSTAVITGGLVSRLTGIPHIWHVREIITQPVWFNKVIANWLNMFADVVIAVSGPAKDHLIKVQPGLINKTVVVHNGLDFSRFAKVSKEEVDNLRRKWKIACDSIVIGMVGRISAWKGQEFLVSAAIPVLKQNPNVKLVLVGGNVPGETTYKENLNSLITKSGVDEQIIVEDFRSDIPVVLSVFDIFVLPSTKPDPFPTVVLEAMAVGKPVIATCHGGAIEQVEDEVTGFLVSPSDTVDMTVALERLVSDKLLREQMGSAGYKRVHEYFTISKYVGDIQSIYHGCLFKNRSLESL